MSTPTFRAYMSLASGPELSVSHAVPLEEAGGVTKLLDDLLADGDFFGVVDQSGNTLQVLFHLDKQIYWFEVAAPEERGSYGRMFRKDEANSRLIELKNPIDRADFDGFRFVSWLDDLPED